MKTWLLKNKDKLMALVVVLIVITFCYSVVSIYKDNNQKHIEELKEINAVAKEAAIKNKIESDSAKIRALQLDNRVSTLQSALEKQTLMLDKIQNIHTQNIYELNQIKYEKNYIPDNVGTDAQSLFISSYKYEPY